MDEHAFSKLLPYYKYYIPILFYSVGNFGFLNIFNIRREAQVFIIVNIILFIPFVLVNIKNIYKSPIFWLVLIYFLETLILRGNQLVFLLDSFLAFLVISFLLALNDLQTQIILKNIIVICFIFSCLVIIQAIIIWFKPELASSIQAGYTSSTGSKYIPVNFPLGYLGFGYNKIHFGNKLYIRFTSF